jgi:hypothetical protein
LTKCLVYKMASWQNDKLTKWQVDTMTSWQNDKLTIWQVDKMTSWQYGKLTKWQADELASWQNGKSKKWLILVDNKSKLTKWLVDKFASWSNGIGAISHHPMEKHISQLPFIIEGTTEKVMEILNTGFITSSKTSSLNLTFL